MKYVVTETSMDCFASYQSHIEAPGRDPRATAIRLLERAQRDIDRQYPPRVRRDGYQPTSSIESVEWGGGRMTGEYVTPGDCDPERLYVHWRERR